MNRLLMSLLLALFASVVVPAQEALRPRFGRFPLEAPPPNPAVVILLPTASPTANTSSQINTISGTCTDDVACTSVTWACPECSTTSGTASGTAEWSFQVTLAEGANVITVTPHDVDMNTPTTDVLTLTYTATDVTSPDIMITTPTSATTDTVSGSPYAIGGTASDNVGVTSVTWVNAAGGSGTATGTTAWTASIGLTNGSNVITMTAHDQAGNTNIDEIDVTLTSALNINETGLAPGTEGVDGSRQMTASGGTGGNTWTNNGAGTTLNDSDADCANTSISSAGLVSWTTGVGEGTCTFTAKVTDSSMTSDTQLINLVFQPAGAESAHTRYDLLIALDEEFRHLNFRSDLSNLAAVGLSGFNSEGYWVYDGATDSGKMTWPEEKTNLTGFEALKWTNIQGTGTDTFIFTFDVKYDVTWNHVSCVGGLLNLDKYSQKAFQFSWDDNGGTGGGTISWELRTNFTLGGAPKTGDCAFVLENNGRAYNDNPYNATGVTNKDPFQGDDGHTGLGSELVSTVNTATSRWTRYVRELRLNVPHTEFDDWETACNCTLAAGNYHMGSDWLMDEIRGPIRIHYKVPLNPQRTATTINTDISAIWWELDSSAEHPQAQGVVEFTGTPGSTIPNNALLQNAGGTVRYQTNASATIQGNGSSGPVNARATVSYDGPIGNAPVGTDLNFVNTPPAGVDDAVETTTAFTGGRYMWDGPPISWWRDAVILKNYALPANPEDDTLIFRKPVP